MHPLKGFKICKGWNSCHTHWCIFMFFNSQQYQSCQVTTFGETRLDVRNIFQHPPQLDLPNHQSFNLDLTQKSSGYRNKKMVINMPTNCRNKMKLEDVCQGVGTAAAKTSAHDRFKWRAAPVPLHGLCQYCMIFSAPIYPHHLSASFALGASSSEGNNFSAGSCIVRTKQSTACEHVR